VSGDLRFQTTRSRVIYNAHTVFCLVALSRRFPLP
jgi:hypothetical protein